MSRTERRYSSNPLRLAAPSAIAVAALLGSLVSAAPAAAISVAEVPSDPATWVATPYSPLTWAEVPAPANTAQLNFDADAGGLPSASGPGTGFTALQPSSAAGSAPYYVGQNLSVAGGNLNVTTTTGIATTTVNNQDNALGVGVKSSGKILRLTTTLASPAAATSYAQGGLWFGPDDKNFVKLVLIATTSTSRQVQLAKETNDVSPTTDQITVAAPSQSNLGSQPIKLVLTIDGTLNRATATYQVGSAAPVSVGALAGLAPSFFDGSLLSASKPSAIAIDSFAGLFATKRRMAETTPLVYSFGEFGLSETAAAPVPAPTALTATGAPSAINLAWTAPSSGGVVGYRVYRSATTPVPTTGSPISGANPVTATSFSDTSTFSGIDYHYAVVGVDSASTPSQAVQAGPARSSDPAGSPVTKVDFTTTAGTSAAGYAKDDGAAYTSGRGFGWTNEAGQPWGFESSARIRALTGQAADPRLASIMQLQSTAISPPNPAVWRLNVPNGTYTVVAAVGDSGEGVAGGYLSSHTIRAEGQAVVAGFVGSPSRQYDEAVRAGVTVSDGTLTIDATGGTNTTLAYLEVYRTALAAPDTEAPAAPTNVSASASAGSITVSWTASSSVDAVGYNVYRSTSTPVPTSGTPLNGSTSVTANSYLDATAVAGTLYYYVVTAVDGASNSSVASTAASAQIPADSEIPAPPTALAATAADSSVTLTWTASTSTDVVGYRVFRGTEPGVSVTGAPGSGIAPTSGQTPITALTFTDTGVTNGTTYFYVVVAVDSAGNVSPKSNEVVAVPRAVNTTAVKIDFTVTNGSPAAGYFADWGQAFGTRTGASQGNGQLTYGWLDADGNILSIVGNGRDRNRAGIPELLDSIIHMQYGDAPGAGATGVATAGTWALKVPNGLYSVKFAVGDAPGGRGIYDSTHVINVEGSIGIEKFVGSAAAEYSTVTSTVGVWDGALTINAVGGTNTKIAYVEVKSLAPAPHVDTVLPANRATGHDTNAGVSATIKIPYAGVGVSPTSLPGNVHLYNVLTGAELPTTVGTSGGNDVISLDPNDPLAPNTAYRFVVTSGVKDGYGVPFVPFTSVFTTGDGQIATSGNFTPLTNIAFEKVELPTGAGVYWSSFAFGPDGKLYGTTIGQGIFRFTVNQDGTLGPRESLGHEGAAIIGLLFDKSSTATNLRVWITSTTANFSEQGQWVSSVHQLSGPSLATDRPIFTGLPRSLNDHLTNSMAYGPDGRIYFQQGSNQGAGDLDNSWGQRGEQLLTAATLVFNPAHPAVASAAGGGSPINVQTAQGGTYDPYATDAPLKIYASGIRNAYDLVWHSNGHLYVPTNGTAGGANTPGVTANPDGTFTRTAASGIPGYSTVNGTDVTTQCVRRGYTAGTVPPTGNIATQKDFLFDVVAGGYYGHPNPERCEWVLNAGNDASTPTAPGTTETKYPLGTRADPNYRGVAYDFQFNKSPNGALEYKSGAFGGQLKGRLIVTRFSNNNDLIFLQPDSGTGKILGAQTSVGISGIGNTTISGVDGFNDPLEVVEDTKTGNLYVNQYDRSGGDQKLYLLRVPTSQQASPVSASVDELIFSTVRSTTSATKSVTVTNNADTARQVNATLVGGQTTEFSFTGGNVSVPAKSSVVLNVKFAPGNVTGQRSTTLRLTSGTVTTDVGLYGLAMLGIEGSNEPTLNDVVGTLGYKINVGWTTLAGGVETFAKGDEVLEPLFVKAGTAAPTMTPLAQYAPREDLPYGWYTGNGTTAEQRKLGSIDINGYQSLLPPTTAGTSPSFDPGSATFGFYYYSNAFKRFGFTEDRLNTGTPHRARIYPARNRSGTPLANTYIVGFEDASNGDYQDYLFVVTGVKPVTNTGSADGGIRVDFTSKAGGLTPGYLRDYGQAYALRTNADQGKGLSFGWKDETTENDLDLSIGGTTNLGNGRDRGTSQPDQRLDSLMYMQGADVPGFNGTPTRGYWQIALPNGQYDVTVAVGDALAGTEIEKNQVNLEQVAAIIQFTPSGSSGSATRHRTVSTTVAVNDGFLTVDARGGTNTKLDYLDILPVSGGDDPSDGAQVKINFQPPEAPTPAGWVADTGAAYSAGAGFGWTSPLTGAPVDRTGINRYRTSPTAGIAYPSSPLLQTYAFLQLPSAALWEYAVPNGDYEVAASVGDSAFLDSVHTVTAEGQPVIASFTPTGATPFQSGKRTVTVTDGKLTIAGTGTNTKINWVSIKGNGLVPAADPSTINIRANGTLVGDTYTGGPASVTMDAIAPAGTSLASLTWRLNGGPATAYTAPIAIDSIGTQVLEVTATNSVGTVTTRSVTFTIVGQSIRINAGGPAVTTGSGAWLADTYFSGGKTYSNSSVSQIAGTTDDPVYLTERSAAGTFGYNVPLSSGTYAVKLHFAEIYWGAPGGGAGGTGKRVFDVNFEGGVVEISGLDLNARVAPATAYVTTNDVTVVDGNLDIDFLAKVDQPKVSAIEIVKIGAAPTAPAAPTSATGALNGSAVNLSWTASSSSGVAGYRVERASLAGGPWTVVSGATPLAGTSFVDSAVPFSDTAFYRVAAVSTAGVSSDSFATTQVTVASLFVPGGVTTSVGFSSVTVNWTAPLGSGVTGYRVERATSASGPWTTLTTVSTVTTLSYTDSALPSAGTYYYRVFSVNASGTSSQPSAVASAVVTTVPQAIRVNTGGPAVTTSGVNWSADTGFSGGRVYVNSQLTSIAGTVDDVLYLSERSASVNLGKFSYDFALATGTYDVKLHFAEIYWGATGGGAGGTGKRVFDVNLEGGAIEVAGLDLNAVVGPATAYVTTRRIAVVDGNLDIDFSATVDRPKVSAIEIVRVG